MSPVQSGHLGTPGTSLYLEVVEPASLPRISGEPADLGGVILPIRQLARRFVGAAPDARRQMKS
jgi:hypothetical protein